VSGRGAGSATGSSTERQHSLAAKIAPDARQGHSPLGAAPHLLSFCTEWAKGGRAGRHRDGM